MDSPIQEIVAGPGGHEPPDVVRRLPQLDVDALLGQRLLLLKPQVQDRLAAMTTHGRVGHESPDAHAGPTRASPREVGLDLACHRPVHVRHCARAVAGMHGSATVQQSVGTSITMRAHGLRVDEAGVGDTAERCDQVLKFVPPGFDESPPEGGKVPISPEGGQHSSHPFQSVQSDTTLPSWPWNQPAGNASPVQNVGRRKAVVDRPLLKHDMAGRSRRGSIHRRPGVRPTPIT